MLLATKTVSDVHVTLLDLLNGPSDRSVIVFDAMEACRPDDAYGCSSNLIEVVSSPLMEVVSLSEVLDTADGRADTIVVLGGVRSDVCVPDGITVIQVCEASASRRATANTLLPAAG